MGIFVLTIKVNETKPCGKKYNSNPELFESEIAAVQYIEDRFPSYSEITERLKEESPWREDVPRTFFAEVPRYDGDGEWDYSTEYTLEIQEMDVRKKLR
jgi:hypothetical protein